MLCLVLLFPGTSKILPALLGFPGTNIAFALKEIWTAPFGAVFKLSFFEGI